MHANPARRAEPGLDAYRALVVVMMFGVHARRLQSVRGDGALDRFLDGWMWTEPYIAASFLFIAGFSLALSHARGGPGWSGKIAKRSGGLLLLSVLLFVPQYGLELPDLALSSGILSAIALAIALTGIGLATARAELALAAIGLVVLGVTAYLDRSGDSVPGLNAGPGGAFPLVAFSIAGALIARARQRHGNRALAPWLLAGLAATTLALLAQAPWITQRASLYRAHAGELALLSLFADGPRRAVMFWNHSALGAVGLLLPLVASLSICLALGRTLADRAQAAPLLVLGRHALAAYVAHLGMLGVVELAGIAPRSAGWTLVLVAGLWAACTVLAFALDSKRFAFQRRTRGRASGTSVAR